MRTGRLLFLGAAFVALAQTGLAQRYSNWRVFRATDGLAESACVSVALTPNGRVIVKHLNLASIGELDGYSTRVFPAPEMGRNRVSGGPGGQFWTITPEGLDEFINNEWIPYSLPEVAEMSRSVSPLVVPPISTYAIRHNQVLVLLPDRLLQCDVLDRRHFTTTTLREAKQTKLEQFSDLLVTSDGSLWVAGLRGIARISGSVRNLKPGAEWIEYTPPDSLRLQNFQRPQEDADGGGVTCVAESAAEEESRAVHFDGSNWKVVWTGPRKVRGAWRAPDRSFWVATISSLVHIENGQAESEEDISARFYFDVAAQTNGIFWLATAEGLFRYSPPLWRSPKAASGINSPVHGFAEDADAHLWFVAGGALHRIDEAQQDEFSFPRSIADARALFPLKNRTLLLDAGNQAFQFDPATGLFARCSRPDGRKFQALGLLKEGSLLVQSFGAADQNFRLETYDGMNFEPFAPAPPEETVWGNVSAFYAAQNGDLWLSGERALAWYHDRKWETIPFSEKTVAEPAVAFIEMADGKIWCATPDEIREFDGQNWSLVRAGLDRVNALRRTRDGSVWLASNSGLQRFFQDVWFEHGLEEGLPYAPVRDIYEDQRGRLWAGAATGLLQYHPEADLDPPRTTIQKLPEKDGDIPEGGGITLIFMGQDKWKYTPRERLLYSYRLDDRDWSGFSELNTVSFSDTELSAGKHYFQVRAMDRNGNIETRPTPLTFAVAVPWYKETRLVLIAFGGMAVALFFAGVAFNRHRRLLRSYAEVEKKVADRTRELEIAGRELMHSQKMNAMGTLAAGIAHDFNNILSIIKGSAQIIEDNLGNSEKVRTRVDRIKTVVEQGAGIVKAMLGFSRGSGEEPALCDLNAVVDDTIKLLGDRFLRDMEVKFTPGPNLPEIPVVREFVQQVLLNFIFNAAEAEAVARRKQVILTTRRMEKLPADLVLVPAGARGYVAISVQDFGCGISPENLPRIFEPFFTTKAMSARRGTGLGLSMVYELARKMDAGLAVESAVDQGSTFTLILPVKD